MATHPRPPGSPPAAPINPCRQGLLGPQAGTLAWGFPETALRSKGRAQLLLPGEHSSASSQEQFAQIR